MIKSAFPSFWLMAFILVGSQANAQPKDCVELRSEISKYGNNEIFIVKNNCNTHVWVNWEDDTGVHRQMLYNRLQWMLPSVVGKPRLVGIESYKSNK